MKRLIALVFTLALFGCAGVVTSVPLTPIPSIGEQARVGIKYGAGGVALSSAMGPGAGTFGAKITARFGKAVRIVGYYDWTDSSIIGVMSATPANIKVMMFGDSCGGSAVPYDAAAVTRKVDLIGGFQPSIYCPGSGTTEPVPANVLSAIEVYNSSCLATAGLGCRLWTLAPQFPAGRLLVVDRPDMHPGVTADSEQDMLDRIAQVLTPSATLKAMRAPRGGKPVMITRHHGERI